MCAFVTRKEAEEKSRLLTSIEYNQIMMGPTEPVVPGVIAYNGDSQRGWNDPPTLSYAGVTASKKGPKLDLRKRVSHQEALTGRKVTSPSIQNYNASLFNQTNQPTNKTNLASGEQPLLQSPDISPHHSRNSSGTFTPPLILENENFINPLQPGTNFFVPSSPSTSGVVSKQIPTTPIMQNSSSKNYQPTMLPSAPPILQSTTPTLPSVPPTLPSAPSRLQSAPSRLQSAPPMLQSAPPMLQSAPPMLQSAPSMLQSTPPILPSASSRLPSARQAPPPISSPISARPPSGLGKPLFSPKALSMAPVSSALDTCHVRSNPDISLDANLQTEDFDSSPKNVPDTLNNRTLTPLIFTPSNNFQPSYPINNAGKSSPVLGRGPRPNLYAPPVVGNGCNSPIPPPPISSNSPISTPITCLSGHNTPRSSSPETALKAQKQDDEDFDSVEAFKTTIDSLEEIILRCSTLLQNREVVDVKKKLEIMKQQWEDKKLSVPVQRLTKSLTEALLNNDTQTAHTIHLQVMVEYVGEVKLWMVAIKRLISAVSNLQAKISS